MFFDIIVEGLNVTIGLTYKFVGWAWTLYNFIIDWGFYWEGDIAGWLELWEEWGCKRAFEETFRIFEF